MCKSKVRCVFKKDYIIYLLKIISFLIIIFLNILQGIQRIANEPKLEFSVGKPYFLFQFKIGVHGADHV